MIKLFSFSEKETEVGADIPVFVGNLIASSFMACLEEALGEEKIRTVIARTSKSLLAIAGEIKNKGDFRDKALCQKSFAISETDIDRVPSYLLDIVAFIQSIVVDVPMGDK